MRFSNEMRYINLRFTYLLTVKFLYCGKSRPSTRQLVIIERINGLLHSDGICLLCEVTVVVGLVSTSLLMLSSVNSTLNVTLTSSVVSSTFAAVDSTSSKLSYAALYHSSLTL